MGSAASSRPSVQPLPRKNNNNNRPPVALALDLCGLPTPEQQKQHHGVISPAAAAMALHNAQQQQQQPPQVITPRREEAMRTSVAFTPYGDQAAAFPYFCPLCMEHFRDILKSKCCGNYQCAQCCIDYLGTRNIISHTGSVNDVLSSDSRLTTIACPHCFTTGYFLEKVSLNEQVRDYSNKIEPSSSSRNQANQALTAASPLRIGDTFEDLKRKMVPFSAVSASGKIVDSEVVVEATPQKKHVSSFSSTTTPAPQLALLSPSSSPSSPSIPTLSDLSIMLSPDAGGEIVYALNRPHVANPAGVNNGGGSPSASSTRLEEQVGAEASSSSSSSSSVKKKQNSLATQSFVSNLFSSSIESVARRPPLNRPRSGLVGQ